MGGLKELMQLTEAQAASIAAANDANALEDALIGILVEFGRKDECLLKMELKERFFNLLFALKEKQPALYFSKELSRYKMAKMYLPLLRKAFEAELFWIVDASSFFLMASDLAGLNIAVHKIHALVSSHKGRVRIAKFRDISCYQDVRIGKVLARAGLRGSAYVFFTREDQITPEALAKKIKVLEAR